MSTAQDKKTRRKANRKARALGLADQGLLQAQQYANRKFNKLAALNNDIDNGSQTERVAAQRARKAMSKPAVKDVPGNAQGYYLKDQTFSDIKLDVKKRYLKPVQPM